MTDDSKQSQVSAILRYLRSGESLTALEALQMFGCFRLASRMHDAKDRLKDGEVIETALVSINSKRVARYSIKIVIPSNAKV